MLQHEKDHAVRILQQHPLNGGPPVDLLCHTFITPRELFYVRSHGSIPSIEPAGWALTVTGLVRTSLRLSLDDLRLRFSRRTITATLECAGNRRAELSSVTPVVGELPWGAEAIGNAIWEGTPLAEVLAAAELTPEARDVAFTGLDEIQKDGQIFGFGGSISLEKALRPDVILVDTMNGAPLPPSHGFPLRVLVPGYIGARSVKWLANIHVQAEPSHNYYQRHAYKLFPPEVNAENVDWSRGTMLEDAPLTSAISEPAEGALIEGDRVAVRGYAYAGGRGVSRVEVACDGRPPWIPAMLSAEQGEWTWRLWEAELPLREGAQRIVARAFDGHGVGQSEDLHTVWNFKGYVNSAWPSVTIRRSETSGAPM